MTMMDDKKGVEKEMEYLQTRQLLKDCIRSKYRKDSNDINKLKSTSDNYGSFFGPSQPSISQRVIEESKLVEFQNTTTKFINSHLPDARKCCFMNIGGTDKTAALNEQQSKTKMIKESRDYSFLFSNNDDAAAKYSHDDQTSDFEKAKEKELIIHQHKKPKLTPHDNNKVMKTLQCDQKYPKVQPSKANSLGAKSQSYSSIFRPGIPIRIVKQKTKTVQQQIVAASSRKQTLLRPKQQQRIKSSSSSSKMKKKKPNHEPIVDYSSVISEVLREVLRYDKTKYGRDYDDDRAMVSNFADIQKEEKRSERLGKKEDKEERILTEEMERKEKKLNQSKKRKLQAHQKC